MLLALLFVFLIASETIVLNAFHTIEVQSAQKDTNRALSILASDINQLDAVAEDWATRGSVDESIAHTNKSGLLTALDDRTLDNLKFNYILFYNASGELIAGKGYDIKQMQETPVPASLFTLPLAPANFLTMQSHGNAIIGIVSDHQDPILLAIQPVYGLTHQPRPLAIYSWQDIWTPLKYCGWKTSLSCHLRYVAMTTLTLRGTIRWQ